MNHQGLEGGTQTSVVRPLKNFFMCVFPNTNQYFHFSHLRNLYYYKHNTDVNCLQGWGAA